MTRRALAVCGVLTAGCALAWLLFIGLPRWYAAPATAKTLEVTTPAAASAGRKIKARLFYVAPDGTRLTAAERDVPYGDGTVQQAREIVTAQLAAAADPLVSAIPPGTALRALFISDHGTAYVDLSGAVSSAHEGGAENELLTVYTIVDALTSNLPAITAVQILVDGKAVETLAGHVDLRRPLTKDLGWVE